MERPFTIPSLMSLALLARAGSAASTCRLVTVISCTEANQVKTNSLLKIQYFLCTNKKQRNHREPVGFMFVKRRNLSSATRTALVELLTPWVISWLQKIPNQPCVLFFVTYINGYGTNRRIQKLISNPRSLSSMVKSLISMPDNRMAAIVPGSSSLVTSMSFSNDSAALLNAFNMKSLGIIRYQFVRTIERIAYGW